MGDWLTWQVAQGLLRNLLLGAGVSLVTTGVLTQGQLSDVVGAVVVIAGVIFTAVSSKNKAKAQAIVAAVEAHPGIRIIPANASISGAPVVLVNDLPPPSLSTMGH
jgi:hypothetical protein